MKLSVDFDENNISTDYPMEEDDYEEMGNMSAYKKDVRRRIEERLERRRLKEDLEDYEGELDGEFDWNEVDR